MTYSEKLQTQEWNDFRANVLLVKEPICELCQTKEKPLQVHHKFYLSKKEPWDYPTYFMMVLCPDCHYDAHKMRDRLFADLAKIQPHQYGGLIPIIRGYVLDQTGEL